MKFSLLFLLLPLHSFAQFGPSYTGPTMQQNQQSRDYFNRSMNQHTQDFQMRQLQKNRSGQGGQRMTAATQLKTQAQQQQAEQEANEKLARLTQDLERKRLEHPAKNPQQAAAQQKEDDKQVNLLAVKNYRDVFLDGQVSNALQARTLSPKADQNLQNLTKNLLNDAWWSKQDGAQLSEKVKAYSDTLTSLTAGLLGFDLASPPPTPAQLSSSRVNELLAKGAFDQKAATQIMQEVAMAEKLIAGKGLAEAALDFKNLNTGAASQALQSDPKKLRKEVMASLRRFNAEMQRYDSRIASLSRINSAQKVIFSSTSDYLKKNGN